MAMGIGRIVCLCAALQLGRADTLCALFLMAQAPSSLPRDDRPGHLCMDHIIADQFPARKIRPFRSRSPLPI